jgi:DHA2 family multidrug resistance protein
MAALNGIVSRQAAMIAYNNDFQLLFVVTLLTMPLVLFLKVARSGKAAPSIAVE